ncbi:serine/threonine-protein kinase [Tautonia sociabilis]|uniref:Protein kinase domain-containing protein n=1 Tax=Tautonia sociabilis TaxID=2080755 RepID=A0A432MGF4_9BACT|nr:hypothetical protein [Tautonia sociabilis]RUL85534.1 hypothetical protein TsocGM_18315 [Tautonia sociabilis]
MTSLPFFSRFPELRAGVYVLGPIRQEATGVSYRAWSPGEGDAVALWVDATRIEDDPIRAERLGRQAIALERIRHPNLGEVVRVADLDGRLAVLERRPEAIEAGFLAAPGDRPGPSAVRRALAIVLQASRGLRALHEAGFAHGDIRPEALAELPDGRMLLTGLGRVAPPAEDPEEPSPPAFPGPDAVRADLEALGRTVFRLVTGSAAGPDSSTPASAINPRVPAAVSELIRRLMLPEDRGGFGAIGPVIADLERIAGAPKPGAFLPRQELVDAYRACADAFAGSPTARLRRTVLLSSYGGTAGLAFLALLVGLSSLAIGLLGLMAMTAGGSFVVGGIARGGPLFDRVRRFVAGGRVRDLATVAAVLILAPLGLVASGTLGVAVALAVVAAILAGVQEVLIDRPIARERREPVDRACAVLRDLRRSGLAEPAVRAFAVDHGGTHWGPLFLSLFGFDAYREARTRREVPTGDRLLRFELIGRVIAAIDARLRARRDERDRLLLIDLLERRLKAQGLFELTARRRAWRIAPALLSRAIAFERGTPTPGGTLAESLAEALRDPETALLDAESAPEPRLDRLRRRLVGLLDALTGPRARLLSGLLLLVGFLAWAHQNRLIEGTDLTELVQAARSADSLEEVADTIGSRGDLLREAAGGAQPLRVALAPGPASALFRDGSAGLAALILLVSSAFRGRWPALGAVLAALIALFGNDLGLPTGVDRGLAVALFLAAVLSAWRC